jgi:5-methylcytosine-specific restriction endonuclease McrA
MRNLRSRRARIKLPPEAYRELHRQVLNRDNWQCQVCGSRNNLQVHHKEFRSHSGDDSEGNLITLCPKCHARAHLTKTTS